MNWFANRDEEREEKEILDTIASIERGELKSEHVIISLLRKQLSMLKRIERQLEGAGKHTPTGIAITQLGLKLQGDFTMAINGIVKGATGTFSETPTPPSSVFPTGTTFVWTSDDTLTTLTPSADGASVAVATSVSDTAASFNLTCTSNFTDPASGKVVAGSVNVPLLPAVVTTPTGLAINQLS